MIKSKKILSTLLLFGLLVGCLSSTAYAGRPEEEWLLDNSNDDSAFEQVSETEVSSDLDAGIYEKDIILETLYNDSAVAYFNSVLESESGTSVGSVELATIEELFDCTTEITTAYQILDTRTGDNYTQFVCTDKTEISVSEDGELFKISTIYSETSPARNFEMSTQEELDYCLELMPDLYSLFGIEEEYTLTESYDFDEDYLFFTFEKTLENGVNNPFQSINVVFDKNTLRFSIAVKFESLPNALFPEISAEEALAVANEYTVDEVTMESAELTYISELIYSSSTYQYDDDVCYLVYEVKSSDGDLIIYIDALNGEYVGTDIMMSETGYAVAIQESKDSSTYNYNSELQNYTDESVAKYNTWRFNKMTWAASAMRRLGYTATSAAYSTSSMITDVKNYLQALSNEYAFYFSGHGNTTMLGFKHYGRITLSDVTGNWHFVFLDACNTAADSGWANAFKINGYSNRAYLGWNGTIGYSYGYLFAQEFWPLIDGNKTIRQAAVDAAALVPGSGTTPIKFYGDTSYTGKAWS